MFHLVRFSLNLLQGPVVTDNSNFIIDCQFDKVKNNMPLIANLSVLYIKSLLAPSCFVEVLQVFATPLV